MIGYECWSRTLSTQLGHFENNAADGTFDKDKSCLKIVGCQAAEGGVEGAYIRYVTKDESENNAADGYFQARFGGVKASTGVGLG